MMAKAHHIGLLAKTILLKRTSVIPLTTIAELEIAQTRAIRAIPG